MRGRPSVTDAAARPRVKLPERQISCDAANDRFGSISLSNDSNR
jgi:hypothetical protein